MAEEKKPCLMGKLKDEKFPILLDYGADISCIDANLCKKLNLKVELAKIQTNLASGNTRIKGKTTLNVAIKKSKQEKPIDFYILENMNRSMLLGYIDIKEMKINIDTEDDSVRLFDGTRIAKKIIPKEVKLQHEITELTVGDEEERSIDDNKVKELLYKYNLFNIKERTLNVNIEHEIYLKDNNKIHYARPYRRSEEQNEIIEEEINRLLKENIIRVSNGRFAAPVVLIKKKDGKPRLCIDYRKLNENTIYTAYPIPHMDELLDAVGQANIYSSLDMEAGYHQVRIKEEDKEKTGFITRQGVFEFNKLPFGLVNAPFTFQKIMNFIFKEYLFKFVVVYLDDILIFSSSREQHYKHLEMVFKKCQEYNIRLNTKKCAFAKTKLTFLKFEIFDGKINISEF